MNQPQDPTRQGSKKLHMVYVLSTEAMSELRNILEDRSVWVPDPDDCRSIGCIHRDELAEVHWAFECLLKTLSAIEDADWDHQHRDVLPNCLLEYLQEAAAPRTSDWLGRGTLYGMRRIHQHLVDAADGRHLLVSASADFHERLMYALCSEAILGIYAFMQESIAWDRGLHHDELLDLLDCFDATKETMDALYGKTQCSGTEGTCGLLRDLASTITDERLKHCREEAVDVIRRPFHAVVSLLARQSCGAK